MAAVEGASSSSQKLAAKVTTTAIQMRIPKAQALAGAPPKLNERVIAVVMKPLLAQEGDDVTEQELRDVSKLSPAAIAAALLDHRDRAESAVPRIGRLP
jgi:hypothetical protein